MFYYMLLTIYFSLFTFILQTNIRIDYTKNDIPIGIDPDSNNPIEDIITGRG